MALSLLPIVSIILHALHSSRVSFQGDYHGVRQERICLPASVQRQLEDSSGCKMSWVACSQVYSQIYNTSYAYWGGNSTLNYTSPVGHAVPLCCTCSSAGLLARPC